jgi:hypothetical protein
MSIHHQPAPAAAHQQARQEQRTIIRAHRDTARPVVRAERPVVRAERPVVRNERNERNERREIRNVREQERYERPIVERHIYARPIIQRSVYVAPAAYWTPSSAYTVAPQPIQLLSPTSLASDQLAIDTGGSLGAATALELDAAGGGSTYVSQIVLVDAYGGTQAIPVNQVLSGQNPSIQLPLSSGSSIVRVIIDGHSDWGGQLAMRAL